MRLSKTRGLDVPRLDAAPCVAVVLLLAWFFFFALDGSQRELDRLAAAADDASGARAERLEVELSADGSVRADGRVLHDPARDDHFETLLAFLGDARASSGALGPRKRVLVRADPRAPFEHVQRLIERAELDEWQVEFAVAGDAAGER